MTHQVQKLFPVRERLLLFIKMCEKVVGSGGWVATKPMPVSFNIPLANPNLLLAL